MPRITALIAVICAVISQSASAFDDRDHLVRVLHCISGDGSSAEMELFLPAAVVYRGATLSDRKRPVRGYYALDLEKVGKGKPLEPVKVWKDEKARVLVIDQHTRGLPPARVPLDGGVVDLDKDFGQAARCKAYGDTREDENGSEFPAAPG